MPQKKVIHASGDVKRLSAIEKPVEQSRWKAVQRNWSRDRLNNSCMSTVMENSGTSHLITEITRWGSRIGPGRVAIYRLHRWTRNFNNLVNYHRCCRHTSGCALGLNILIQLLRPWRNATGAGASYQGARRQETRSKSGGDSKHTHSITKRYKGRRELPIGNGCGGMVVRADCVKALGR